MVADALTHAVTVPQPLAWAVAAGYCPVLMSVTRPPLEREGELIGIHAAARASTDSEHDAFYAAHRLAPNQCPTHSEYRALPRGALIGVARLVGVVRATREPGTSLPEFVLVLGRGSVTERLPYDLRERIHPWWRSNSPWGLLLTDAVLLPASVPMRGAGGVWCIGGDAAAVYGSSLVAARALEQWRKARGA